MIVIVIGSANLGGSEVLALNLAQWMHASGDACELVFLSSEDGPARRRAERLGVAVHVVDESSVSRPRFVIALARLLRERSAEHVLAFMFGVHLYVALAAKLAHVPNVVAFVGNPAPLDVTRLRRTKRRARLAQPLTTCVVSCSCHVADSIVAAYGLRRDKVKVIHNWCDVDAIASRSEALRSVTSAEDVVGMIARMDPIKDHPTLVKAFAIVAGERPHAVLRLAGDGPTRSSLEELIAELGLSERVQMVGAIDDAVTELARLTTFVFTTTDQEGFGLVLAEAMAAGVPIVAMDVGPVAEVLDGQRGGHLVPPNRIDLLAQEITSVLVDTQLRSEMSRTAHELAHARYTVERAGMEIKAMLDVV